MVTDRERTPYTQTHALWDGPQGFTYEEMVAAIHALDTLAPQPVYWFAKVDPAGYWWVVKVDRRMRPMQFLKLSGKRQQKRGCAEQVAAALNRAYQA